MSARADLVFAATTAAKEATIALGVALQEYEAALEVLNKAESEDERAELHPMIEQLRTRVTAADARATAAIATLKKIEEGLN